MEKYKTLKNKTSSYYKDKGSKFWAYAFPVNSLEEVNNSINEVKTKHPSSGHYCYAYRLGLNKNIVYRANDDGEPKGSAGLPILNQIKSAGITNTLIVVVRDFGGTKLGISGLISAYKTATLETLKSAEIIEKEIQVKLNLNFNYETLGEIRSILDRKKIEVIKSTYNDLVCFTIRINKSELNKTKKLFNHLDIELNTSYV